MFFHVNTIKKDQKCQSITYMPNTIFSCQTTLKKAKFLEFGLKNANLATLLLRLVRPLYLRVSERSQRSYRRTLESFDVTFTGTQKRIKENDDEREKSYNGFQQGKKNSYGADLRTRALKRILRPKGNPLASATD